MLRSFGTACLVLTSLAFVGTSILHAQAAARVRSANNLRKLALAFHNYHDSLGVLPYPTVYSKDKKPLYSWRVAILPFIDEDKLYKEFKLDEPWDSEHNKKLLDKMPKVFAPVTDKTKEKNVTHYQVLVGHRNKEKPTDPPIFDEPGPGRPAKVRLTDITDGTANTIMIVEAKEPVPWTKPADLDYDPEKPLPKFGGMYKDTDGFNVAFADASVRFLLNVDEKVMRAIITRSGGENVDVKNLKLK